MEQTYAFQPKNVCSREIRITHEDGLIKKVVFLGGCPGNTLGVSRLLEGRTIDEVLPLIEGIKCPGSRTKQTSCPDQLANALKQIKANQ